MTTDFPTAPSAYGLNGPSAAVTVEKSLHASHTEILTLPAHHDLDATVTNYPHYDVAIVAANFMFDRLRNLADPDSLGGIPTSLDHWSQTVARNMSAIVRKAFEASASLGSNVPTRPAD